MITRDPIPTHLTMEEYSKLAFETAKDDESFERAMELSAIGVCEEAGEFAGHVKKVFFHHHELTDEVALKMVKELGDQLWYINHAIKTLAKRPGVTEGMTLTDVGRINIEKLRERYKNTGKMNTEESVLRRDETKP